LIKETLCSGTISAAKTNHVYSIDKNFSFLATVELEKEVSNNEKYPKIKIKHEFNFIHFDLIYLLKPFNMIDVDQKTLKYNLSFFCKPLINSNKDDKYSILGLGFNLETFFHIIDKLSELKEQYHSEFSPKIYLKWKYLIKKLINLKKKAFILYNNNNSDDIILQLSEANANLRLSNIISPLDIRFSINIILESIKSLNI
jgi:hypothetical protein